MLRRVDHVALRVPYLRKAEALYLHLFDLTVAYREVETPEGWLTLPPEMGWAEAEAAGARIGLSVLSREGLVLQLEGRERVVPGERLAHVGLDGDEGEISRLESLVWGLGGQVVTRLPDHLVFDDAYGVRWDVSANRASYVSDTSSGARSGRWFRPRSSSAASRRGL